MAIYYCVLGIVKGFKKIQDVMATMAIYFFIDTKWKKIFLKVYIVFLTLACISHFRWLLDIDFSKVYIASLPEGHPGPMEPSPFGPHNTGGPKGPGGPGGPWGPEGPGGQEGPEGPKGPKGPLHGIKVREVNCNQCPACDLEYTTRDQLNAKFRGIIDARGHAYRMNQGSYWSAQEITDIRKHIAHDVFAKFTIIRDQAEAPSGREAFMNNAVYSVKKAFTRQDS
jgi:hypothetical protein